MEIPVHPENQNKSFAGNVPDPKIIRHVTIPAQRRHQRDYEDVEPRRVRGQMWGVRKSRFGAVRAGSQTVVPVDPRMRNIA